MRINLDVHTGRPGRRCRRRQRHLAFVRRGGGWLTVLAVGLSLALPLALAGCGKEPPPPEEPPVRAVRLLEVGAQEQVAKREYPGQIAASTEAEVSFEVAGRIVELPVGQGQWVKKGELLASLDTSDFQARLDAAVAQRNAALADYQRYEELLAKNAVSKRDFESRKRNWEVAEANLRIDEKNVADTSLRAPFTGRVARKHVEQFQNVQAKQPILLLQDSSVLEIDVSLPEADLLRADPALDPQALTERLNPEVAISSVPGRGFPARLTELATAADPTTRTFEATFSFEAPPDVLLLPGMTALIRVSPPLGGLGAGFVLPVRAAVIDESGAAFVWKVDPATMKAHKVQVELGELSGESVLVESGLQPGDLVAATGVHQLREDMQVRRLETP